MSIFLKGTCRFGTRCKDLHTNYLNKPKESSVISSTHQIQVTNLPKEKFSISNLKTFFQFGKVISFDFKPELVLVTYSDAKGVFKCLKYGKIFMEHEMTMNKAEQMDQNDHVSNDQMEEEYDEEENDFDDDQQYEEEEDDEDDDEFYDEDNQSQEEASEELFDEEDHYQEDEEEEEASEELFDEEEEEEEEDHFEDEIDEEEEEENDSEAIEISEEEEEEEENTFSDENEFDNISDDESSKIKFIVPKSMKKIQTTTENMLNLTRPNSSSSTVKKTHSTDNFKAIIGKCTTMCPLNEIKEREQYNELSIFECVPNQPNKADINKCVKKYRRSDAGKEYDPNLVRPIKVLVQTMNFLCIDCLNSKQYSLSEKYTFLADRFRAIRVDFFVQNIKNIIAITQFEKMVRFHALCQYIMKDKDIEQYDPVRNTESMTQTLLSLRLFYNDNHQQMDSFTTSYESEIRSYHLLVNFNQMQKL